MQWESRSTREALETVAQTLYFIGLALPGRERAEIGSFEPLRHREQISMVSRG